MCDMWAAFPFQILWERHHVCPWRLAWSERQWGSRLNPKQSHHQDRSHTSRFAHAWVSTTARRTHHYKKLNDADKTPCATYTMDHVPYKAKPHVQRYVWNIIWVCKLYSRKCQIRTENSNTLKIFNFDALAARPPPHKGALLSDVCPLELIMILAGGTCRFLVWTTLKWAASDCVSLFTQTSTGLRLEMLRGPCRGPGQAALDPFGEVCKAIAHDPREIVKDATGLSTGATSAVSKCATTKTMVQDPRATVLSVSAATAAAPTMHFWATLHTCDSYP